MTIRAFSPRVSTLLTWPSSSMIPVNINGISNCEFRISDFGLPICSRPSRIPRSIAGQERSEAAPQEHHYQRLRIIDHNLKIKMIRRPKPAAMNDDITIHTASDLKEN